MAAQSSVPKSNVDTFTSLYVKCFPLDYNEETLCDFFGGCGPIQAVKMMCDPRGRKSAFVTFERHDDAKMCVEEMHRKDLRPKKERRAEEKLKAEGKAPPVIADADGHPEHLLYVQRAQSKAERQAMFEGKGGLNPKGKGKGGGGTVFYGGSSRDTSSDTKSTAPSEGFGQTSSPAPQPKDVPLTFTPQQQPAQRQLPQQSSYTNGTSYGEGNSIGAYDMSSSYAANSDNGYGGSSYVGYGTNYDWDSYNGSYSTTYDGAYSGGTSMCNPQMYQLQQQQQQQYWSH